MASNKELFDVLAAGQWDGISPRPTLATRRKAWAAYDLLSERDPKYFPPRTRRLWVRLVEAFYRG